MGERKWRGWVLVVGAIAIALVVLGVLSNGRAPASVAATPTAASSAVGPTAAPTTAASDAGTASPTAQPTQDTFGIVQAFFDSMGVEIAGGTQQIMADRLAPAVIDRYGVAACYDYLASQDAVPVQAYTVITIHDPAPWDYVTDGISTTIPGVTAVDTRLTSPDASGVPGAEIREQHVQLIDGIVYWFTDCGTPLD